jgi:hypothetical protein
MRVSFPREFYPNPIVCISVAFNKIVDPRPPREVRDIVVFAKEMCSMGVPIETARTNWTV